MNKDRERQLSKFLSYLLRHHPEEAGLTPDRAGWVDVDKLLLGVIKAGHTMTRADLDFVVEHNSKRRFEFTEDGEKIRASQGHSIPVELEYVASTPPDYLYHGTPAHFIESIRCEGLKKMQRHHVHLHEEYKLAKQVGGRRGKPVVLKVNTSQMARDGFDFFLSNNGVWLVQQVPPKYLEFPDSESDSTHNR